MADDLVAFLTARLDEDEAAARATAEPHRWHPDHFSPGEVGAVDQMHIARHDPARVLREAAADRALLAAYWAASSQPEEAGLEIAVRLRATVYSDHPGYQPEWKP